MRFKLWSDLHLEFEKRVLNFKPAPHYKNDKKTVLILAGDIAVGLDAEPFIKKMCQRFYKVIYILGNHEFYDREYNKVRKQWADRPQMPNNFIFLDDDVVVIDGIRIIGGTLWTDFDNSDWHKMFTAKQGMNDFHCIKFKTNTGGSYRKRSFIPEDTVRAHNITKTLINETLLIPFDGKTIVITHHLPHPLCVHRQFKNHPLNCAYVTNLDAIIEQHDIAVWVHGHTHTNVDIEVHGTRILCNPRGYFPRDLNSKFDEKFTFEV